jgi:hypothetical protein
VQCGAQRGQWVDALFLVEAAVLDGDDRGLHAVRDLVEGGGQPVLVVQVGQWRAVAVQHRGGQRHLVGGELGVLDAGGDPVRGVGELVGQHAEPHDPWRQHRGQHHPGRHDGAQGSGQRDRRAHGATLPGPARD